MNYLGLHNKPKAEVHLERMRTGPKEEEEEEEEEEEAVPMTSAKYPLNYYYLKYCRLSNCKAVTFCL